MNPVGNQVTTRPIQKGCKLTIKPYSSGRFRIIDDWYRQFGNNSVWTLTRTQPAGPEPLLTVTVSYTTVCASSDLIVVLH